MANSTPVRTSGRKRQRTSYTLDVFDSLNLSGSSDEEEETPARGNDDEDEDDEYSIGEDEEGSVGEKEGVNGINGAEAVIEDDSEEFDGEDLNDDDDEIMSIDRGTAKGKLLPKHFVQHIVLSVQIHTTPEASQIESQQITARMKRKLYHS
jgi:hypothetical protein